MLSGCEIRYDKNEEGNPVTRLWKQLCLWMSIIKEMQYVSEQSVLSRAEGNKER